MPTTFAELGAPADLVRTLHARGIDAPFAIQSMTLADGLAGRDLSGRAPTGSGKTLAFGIPMATRVSRADPKHPTGLVLVPTRELAAQVCAELEWLGGHRKLRVAAVYGGAGFGGQLKALRRGVDVLVACPGRLKDLLERREVHLDSVEVVVIDEADRMADMGFLPAVRELLDLTPATRQTLLFSATLDGAVDTLVRNYQRDPVRHLLPDVPEDRSRATHFFWKIAREERVSVCADVVKLAGPTIVFCKTKRGTDQIAKKLQHAGVRTEAIHGNRSQGQRERALAAFADGKVEALIATDVAARGIHVDSVACVVHFDPPHDDKDYTHRSGRTARAGAAGSVVSFVLPENERSAQRLQRTLGLPRGLDRADRAALASLTPDSVNRRPEVPAASTGAAAPEIAAVPTVTVVDSSDAAGRTRGVVKWFDPRKGFGFIARHDGDDVFVHSSAIDDGALRDVAEGEHVDFEVVAGKKGAQARKVRLLVS